MSTLDNPLSMENFSTMLNEMYPPGGDRMKRTLVIGDVHGHPDLLLALLKKAGIKSTETIEERDFEIVQLGDLGHFGEGSAQRDLESYEIAYGYGIQVLWGNHDMAVFNQGVHSFRGFEMPTDPSMFDMMWGVDPKFALARHGYLLTHAGLHPKFLVPGMTVEGMADHLNRDSMSNAIHSIGHARGGLHEEGGILWRDDSERLARINQVYGHTRGLVRRSLLMDGTDRWCIDVAEKGLGSHLVGLWLPDLTLVAVGPDPAMYEQWISA